MLVTAGLLRFGPSFENIAWASLFFLAPLGCAFTILWKFCLNWLQVIAKVLPLVHIFEEMRNILLIMFLIIIQHIKSIISFFYFIFGVLIFYIAYFGAKKEEH